MRSGPNIRAAILVVNGLIKIYSKHEYVDEYFMYYLDQGKACGISLVCALVKERAMSVQKMSMNQQLFVPANYVDEWPGSTKVRTIRN